MITTAEQHLGDAGYPLVHIVHQPELTDFCGRLGYAPAPDGLRIGTPVGVVAQSNPTGYTGSWKALRDQVCVENLRYANGTFADCFPSDTRVLVAAVVSVRGHGPSGSAE